jgi:hypothetical protein
MRGYSYKKLWRWTYVPAFWSVKAVNSTVLTDMISRQRSIEGIKGNSVQAKIVQIGNFRKAKDVVYDLTATNRFHTGTPQHQPYQTLTTCHSLGVMLCALSPSSSLLSLYVLVFK